MPITTSVAQRSFGAPWVRLKDLRNFSQKAVFLRISWGNMYARLSRGSSRILFLSFVTKGEFMKIRKFLSQSLVFLVGLGSLTACSAAPFDFQGAVPVDHKAYACEKFGEMRQVWIGVGDDDEVLASNASLSAVMAVWQAESGEEDPLYWKMHRYMKDLSTLLLDPSPEAARTSFATEDEVLAEIETECALPNTYVAPLKIQGGCWDGKTVKAQLQSRFEGKWINGQKVGKLSKIKLCSDPGYPWGAEFTYRRVITDGPQEFRIIWTEADGGTFANGKSKIVYCSVPVVPTDLEVTLYPSDCD